MPSTLDAVRHPSPLRRSRSQRARAVKNRTIASRVGDLADELPRDDDSVLDDPHSCRFCLPAEGVAQ
jgi:hypothetical protein